MSLETNSNKTKVCPTCGTRLSESATRCLVCGTEFNAKPEPKAVKKVEKSVQASRMPVLTLSLPAAIGIVTMVIIIVAVVAFLVIRQSLPAGTLDAQISPTPSETPTATLPPTATIPPTDIPTATPLPPFDYTVAEGDGTCSQIAYTFGISVQSIIITNNLP